MEKEKEWERENEDKRKVVWKLMRELGCEALGGSKKKRKEKKKVG